MKVEYYYSIASPFSYLALERFLSLVKKYNLEIEEKPLDLVGKIFSNTGGLPVPKRHPSRQKYRLIEIDRIAKKALKNGTKLRKEAIKSGLINERDYDLLIDPMSMIKPS